MNKSLILLLILALSFSGCATQRILLGGESNKDPDFTKSQAFWMGGTFQTKDIDAEAVCGDRGVQKIETEQGFFDTILGTITVGFYTPRTAKVYCNKNPEYHIEKRYGQVLVESMSKISSAIEIMSTRIDSMQQQIDDMKKNGVNVVKVKDSDIPKKKKHHHKKKKTNNECIILQVPSDYSKGLQILDIKSCPAEVYGPGPLNLKQEDKGVEVTPAPDKTPIKGVEAPRGAMELKDSAPVALPIPTPEVEQKPNIENSISGVPLFHQN